MIHGLGIQPLETCESCMNTYLKEEMMETSTAYKRLSCKECFFICKKCQKPICQKWMWPCSNCSINIFHNYNCKGKSIFWCSTSRSKSVLLVLRNVQFVRNWWLKFLTYHKNLEIMICKRLVKIIIIKSKIP